MTSDIAATPVDGDAQRAVLEKVYAVRAVNSAEALVDTGDATAALPGSAPEGGKAVNATPPGRPPGGPCASAPRTPRSLSPDPRTGRTFNAP